MARTRRIEEGSKHPRFWLARRCLLGPTGVDEPSWPKALQFLFDDEVLMRVDMSNSARRRVAPVIQCASGYVGYTKKAANLHRKIVLKPFSPSCYRQSKKNPIGHLQHAVLCGCWTIADCDSRGRQIGPLQNTIIVDHCNLGTRDVYKAANTGFSRRTPNRYRRMKEQVLPRTQTWLSGFHQTTV